MLSTKFRAGGARELRNYALGLSDFSLFITVILKTA